MKKFLQSLLVGSLAGIVAISGSQDWSAKKPPQKSEVSCSAEER